MNKTKAKERFEQLQEAHKKRKLGKFNLLPWYEHFPRLSQYVPGLIPGQMYKILSFSGIK